MTGGDGPLVRLGTAACGQNDAQRKSNRYYFVHKRNFFIGINNLVNKMGCKYTLFFEIQKSRFRQGVSVDDAVPEYHIHSRSVSDAGNVREKAIASSE